MRPTRLVLVPTGAVSNSPWLPIDYAELAFSVNLGFIISNGAVLTGGVQYTLDDFSDDAYRQVQISNTANVATVTDNGPIGVGPNPVSVGHGLSVGDSIIVIGSKVGIDANGLTAAQVANVATVISATQYTYATGVAGSVVADPTVRLKSFRVFPATGISSVSARTNGSLGFPVTGVRLVTTAFTSGFIELLVNQGHGK